MTKKHKVTDAELEKVNGGGGVMDPPAGELQSSGNRENQDEWADSVEFDLSNDMIITTGDRE